MTDEIKKTKENIHKRITIFLKNIFEETAEERGEFENDIEQILKDFAEEIVKSLCKEMQKRIIGVHDRIIENPRWSGDKIDGFNAAKVMHHYQIGQIKKDWRNYAGQD